MFESTRTSLGENFLLSYPLLISVPRIAHVGPIHPLHLVLPGHLVLGCRPDPAGVDVTDVSGPRAFLEVCLLQSYCLQ